MASSLGDKSRILEYASGRILDVGAGGGELTEALGAEALESDPEYAAALEARGITTTLGEASDIANLYGAETLDTVVFCSVLHEVWSSGGADAWANAIIGAHRVLKPGGRLIIRDGVMPERPDRRATLEMLDGNNDAVRRYLALQDDHAIRLLHITGNQWTGSLHSVAEFAFTYTWGDDEERYDREARERYQLFTAERYPEVVEARGFERVFVDSYRQPGYRHHLERKVQMRSDDGVMWPDTNMLMVFTKTAYSEA